MSQVKLPYCPNEIVQVTETRFGIPEISLPTIYDKGVQNKIIVKVDLLSCLTPIWGEACQIYREPLYKIVSGSCSVEEHNNLIAAFYRRFPEVTEYINNLFSYGEKSIPIGDRVVSEVNKSVNAYKDKVLQVLNDKHGKFLVISHAYVYYAFAYHPELDELRGVTFIC